MWEDEAVVPLTAVSSQRRWRVALLGLVLVGVASWLVYRQVNRRMEAIAADVEADFLASHDLVRLAAQQGDAELVNTILSGRDLRWAQAYERLVADRVLYDRSPWGLTWLPEEGEVVDVTLSPDLMAAELLFNQSYQKSVTETVVLQQTAVYRLGPNRWLFSPPDNDFWGTWQRQEGTLLTLVYAARDEAMALQLHSDLEAVLQDMCDLLTRACPASLQVTVRLDTQPDSLVNVLLEPQSLWRYGRYRILLPSPTLVGLPVDEVGYEVLRRRYARQMVSVMIADLTDYQCCTRDTFFRALLARQLDELGLQSWPLNEGHYMVVGRQPEDLAPFLETVTPFWHNVFSDAGQIDDWWRVYILTDFLLTIDPKVTPANLQNRLHARSSYNGWLEDVLWRNPSLRGSTLSPEEHWNRFISLRTGLVADEMVDSMLPTQELLVVCDGRLNRYRPLLDSWQDAGLTMAITEMRPLPDDSGVYVEGTQDRWQALVWRGGETQLLYRPPFNRNVFFHDGQLDVYGRFLLVTSSSQTETESSYGYFDLAACEDCEVTETPGPMRWSPSGEQFVRLRWVSRENGLNNYLLTHYAGEEEETIGLVHDAFWLDEATYAYLRQTSAEPILTFASAEADRIVGVLPPDDLRVLLPYQASTLLVADLLVNPVNSEQLFVWVTDSLTESRDGSHHYHLFMYDRSQSDLALVLSLEAGHTLWGTRPLSFSPDGRWFMLSTVNGEETAVTITLYEIAKERQEVITIPFEGGAMPSSFRSNLYDWSANSQWLAILTPEGIRFYQPDQQLQQQVPAFSTCTSLAWVD